MAGLLTKLKSKVLGPTLLAAGSPAPGFRLPSHDGRTIDLADLKGRKVLLWFYPKADTAAYAKGRTDAMRGRIDQLEQESTAAMQGFSASPNATVSDLLHFNQKLGAVRAAKAAVASKATGRLEWLGVREGSTVRAGELIGRLDASDVQAAVVAAEAGVRQAEAGVNQAEAALRRSEAQLRALARKAAERVKETGRAVQLEPMTALERRWIHVELQEVEGIATESAGEEPDRRVVVIPA